MEQGLELPSGYFFFIVEIDMNSFLSEDIENMQT
jgi:hypothetical protein